MHTGYETIPYGETLILQCIISGVIFVFVLIASMTNLPPAATLQEGVTQVLTGAETLDELVSEVRQLGTEWFGLEPATTYPPLLDDTIPTQDYDDYLVDYSETEYPSNSNDSTELTYYYEEPTADELSNYTVPESSGTPGLWD